jgi:hypothetical protein
MLCYQYQSGPSFYDRPIYQDQAGISKEWYQTNTGINYKPEIEIGGR